MEFIIIFMIFTLSKYFIMPSIIEAHLTKPCTPVPTLQNLPSDDPNLLQTQKAAKPLLSLTDTV